MWRKAEETKMKAAAAAPPATMPSLQGAGPLAQQSGGKTPMAVSHGIKIRGEISGQGDFFLDGDFEGKIDLPGGSFTVGPNARVQAEIEAREVVIRGEVIGALKHCERVLILSSGKLTGNMETRGIVIEDGAELHSKVAVPQEGTSEAMPNGVAKESAVAETATNEGSGEQAKGITAGQ